MGWWSSFAVSERPTLAPAPHGSALGPRGSQDRSAQQGPRCNFATCTGSSAVGTPAVNYTAVAEAVRQRLATVPRSPGVSWAPARAVPCGWEGGRKHWTYPTPAPSPEDLKRRFRLFQSMPNPSIRFCALCTWQKRVNILKETHFYGVFFPLLPWSVVEYHVFHKFLLEPLNLCCLKFSMTFFFASELPPNNKPPNKSLAEGMANIQL